MGQGLEPSTYFVVDHRNDVVFETGDFHLAREQLHRLRDGSRLIRGDGVTLAFMASSGSAKVRKRIPKRILKLNGRVLAQ